MATLINKIENMTMAHLSHKQRTSFMNINSVPKRTWKRIIMKFCFVVILLIFCSPYSSYASHDPWGENLQPKLHTDYLNEYSGKKKNIIFDKNFFCCQNKMVFDKNWIQFLFRAHSNLKQQQNISPNYSNKTI